MGSLLFKVGSIMVGKLRQQEVDAVGHIASPLSEQRVRNVCVQRFTLYTIQNPDPENSAANTKLGFMAHQTLGWFLRRIL